MYHDLLEFLRKKFTDTTLTIKPEYFVINKPGSQYHITVYQNQWDDYEKEIAKPYHLFHISSNRVENRCSSYFWVNRITYKIRSIPTKYFKYNQNKYSLTTSTRSPCLLKDILRTLRYFQKILDEAYYNLPYLHKNTTL